MAWRLTFTPRGLVPSGAAVMSLHVTWDYATSRIVQPLFTADCHPFMYRATHQGTRLVLALRVKATQEVSIYSHSAMDSSKYAGWVTSPDYKKPTPEDKPVVR